METRKNSFKKWISIFLILNTFILVHSVNIEYDPETKSAEKKEDSVSSNENKYTLIIQNGNDMPPYIQVTLTPKEGQETPSFCYSPTDPNCVKDRRIMVSRVDKQPASACVKNNEIPVGSQNKLNVLVTCKQEKCGYTLSFKGVTRCQIDANKGIVYSYVISKDNQNMEFEAIGTCQDSTFMNIGIDGLEDTSTKIDIAGAKDIKTIQYDGVVFHYFQMGLEKENITSLSNFTVSSSKIGSYIRLNVYTAETFVGLIGPDNLIYPGGPAVLGAVFRNAISSPELCLPVSAFVSDEFSTTTDFYLSVKVYSKYALFWLGDENAYYQEDTDIEIADGLFGFVVKPKGTKRHICFEHSYEDYVEKKDVVFSAQIIPYASKTTPDFFAYNPPMLVGQSYRYVLQKGKALLYHGTRIDKTSGRFSVNLFNRIGVAELYVADCKTFPNCAYNNLTDEWLEEHPEVEKVRNTGKISTYDRRIENNIETLDQNKKVLVIKCADDGLDNIGYCEFDASFMVKGQTIPLVEGENFAKYAVKNEEGKFKIDFKNAYKILNIGVEIMVHTGEVIFDGEIPGASPSQFPIKKYILSNKVFINFDLKRTIVDNILVKFTALKSSFFTIKYIIHKSDEIAPYTNEVIFAGESYLVNMDPISEPLTLHFNNDRFKSGQQYLANFFSLNCDFKVTTTKNQIGETEIPFADGYAQDILGTEEGDIYKKEYYDYKVSIEKVEQSDYSDKMCMLYVIGYQTMDLFYSSRIFIGNNVNQQIIFTDFFRSVKFLYPVPDTSIDMVIYVNIIDKAYYYINVALDSETNTISRKIVTKSTPFYLKSEDYSKNCTKDTFCNIIIELEYSREIETFPKTNHMIEVTVREATKKSPTDIRVPTYLQKGIAKKDFTTGDGYYYLYTDIGKNDQGDITINFFRDYGEVYGRIVKKNSQDDPQEVEWMNKYRLPGEEYPGDDDNYNKYLKKYHFTMDDTVDCNDGCYLILGIIISQIGEWAEDWKFYTFSIISEINQNPYGEFGDQQVITIQVDEFIIGNVQVSKSVKINKFYQVWLPHDSHEVDFDWQSELAGLYISLGDSLPTVANADFVLLPDGKDSVLHLKKSEIISKAEEKGVKIPQEGSLEDVKLTIGVWTDKTDSADVELYSLKVHEVNKQENDLDIYEVNTDQKMICKPREIESGTYACLFMIMYDEQDAKQNMDLLVYSSSTNKGDSVVMYGTFLDSNIYDAFIVDSLRGSIPSENAPYNSIKDNTNYFYVKLKEYNKGYYFYVNVIGHYPDDIIMVSSINSYDEETPKLQIFYPNARTEQIVQIKDKSDTLILEFSANYSLIVNIENLGGEADVRWEEAADTVHYLRGKGDRLTLTTSSNYKRLIFQKLKSDQEIEGEKPGFVFLVDFYTRNPLKNFDEVVYGNSIEIGYRDTDLPVYLYSKAVDYSNDINLAVTFRDSHIDTEGEFNGSPIEVKAYLDKRNTIYAAKVNPEFSPSEKNKFDGIYDPSIKTAQVFLPDIEINQHIKIKPEEFPTLLLYLGKSEAYKDKVYKTFNVEAQFSRTNSLIIPVEKVYNYGKFNGMVTQYYKLRNDKNKPIMKIEISFNSHILDWTIGNLSSHSNSTKYELNTKVSKGKILVTIQPGNEDFVFFNVFKSNILDDPHPPIQNYAFLYINIESEDQFYDYGIKNNDATLEYKETKNNGKIESISCTFNPIDIDYKNANVTYFLKIADGRYYIPGENFTTVAVTESPYYSVYKRNPEIGSNNKITLTANGDFSYWCYIQITAQIQQNKVLEFVAYDGIYTDRNTPKQKPSGEDDDSSSNTALFVGISVTLVILIAVLVVLVIYFQKKNKSLMNQVKHVSFQQVTDTSTDPDLLLAKKN